MKILLVSYFFNEDASGVISGRVVRELVRQGVEVHVVTSSIINDSFCPQLTIHRVKDVVSDKNLVKRSCIKILRILGIGIFPRHRIWSIKAIFYISHLLKKEHFDWLYCRSTPFDSNHVGYMVSKKRDIKVLQHFTDPYPPEGGFLPKNVSREKLIRQAKKIIEVANLVSFGNEAMLNYEREITNLDFSAKSFASNDIASSSIISFIPKQHTKSCNLVYMGTIYPPRNPIPLVNAIRELDYKDLILRVYSDRPILSPLTESFVRYVGRTNDVPKALAEADILVDIDGDSDNPVYISSKLKDYLLINRPILSITPVNSPSSRILSGLRTVRVVDNKRVQIIEAINYLSTSDFQDDDYTERMQVIQRFSPEIVVKEIINKMEHYS